MRVLLAAVPLYRSGPRHWPCERRQPVAHITRCLQRADEIADILRILTQGNRPVLFKAGLGRERCGAAALLRLAAAQRAAPVGKALLAFDQPLRAALPRDAQRAGSLDFGAQRRRARADLGQQGVDHRAHVHNVARRARLGQQRQRRAARQQLQRRQQFRNGPLLLRQSRALPPFQRREDAPLRPHRGKVSLRRLYAQRQRRQRHTVAFGGIADSCRLRRHRLRTPFGIDGLRLCIAQRRAFGDDALRHGVNRRRGADQGQCHRRAGTGA